MGMTLLAVGASLPDTIAIGIAAKRGDSNMAIAGLIGSNAFDLLLGWAKKIMATLMFSKFF